MSLSQESRFEAALSRYRQGAPASELISEFVAITAQAPRLSAGWTCLAWLQLLADQAEEALRSARTAVKLNPQDPQARINLVLALLETGGTGVREHVEVVQRIMLMAPDLAQELKESMEDGMTRRPGWSSLEKLQGWLLA